MKTIAPLPEALRYLQPIVNSLAKLTAQKLNEDVNPARLEAALRRRLRGLTGDDADEALIGDRQLLDEWLKASGSLDHPAYWILGYLSLPGLASYLNQPPEPSDPGPTISFVPPHGWKVKIVPFRLDLKHGKLWAEITTINELGFAIEK